MNYASIVTLIGVVGTISGIIFGYLGYSRGQRKDSRQLGSDSGALKTDIEYIKRRTDDVLLEQKDTNKTLGNLSERVTRVEESTKQAHKRIDKLENNN